MTKICVEEVLLKNILSSMDMMLTTGEWYCAQERADALREVLNQSKPTIHLPVLVGSRALSYWTGMKLPENADWDVISENPIQGTEHHPMDKLNNAVMASRYATNNFITLPDGSVAQIMSMEGLAIMKRSHLHRDLSFAKHLTHYHKWGLVDVVRGKFFQHDLKVRTELTMKEYPVKHPNLMQSKDDFFADGVDKVYDHDWLHMLYAYRNNMPIYVDMLRHGDMAWCEKDKWDTFSFTKKCQCVVEEVYVIATERFLIPNNWEYSYHKAYLKALEKVCTTLCSGWFRDFAIDTHPILLKMFSHEKFQKVYNTISSTPEESRVYHVRKGN